MARTQTALGRCHDVGVHQRANHGVPGADAKAALKAAVHGRQHGLEFRAGLVDDLAGRVQDRRCWTVVEMKFGDEETGQAGVEVVASADGVPAGVGIECDQGELLGEQHVRNASGDRRLLSVRK